MIETKGTSLWLEPAVSNGTADQHVVFRGRPGRGSGPSKQKRKRRHAVDCGTKRASRKLLRVASLPRRQFSTAESFNLGPRRRDTVRWEERAKLKVQSRRRGRGSGRGRGRQARSISLERHVEVLLVADPSMTAFHQDRDIETYLLAIMNMVSTSTLKFIFLSYYSVGS